MKTRWIKGLAAAVAVLGLVVSANAEDGEDTFDILLGGGFLISPGYQDFVDDVYESIGYSDEGGSGWLDLYGGVEIRPAQQFGILIGCDMLLNGMDASGGPLDESYANLILVPSIYGQLYLTESRMFYINGGFSLPLPTTSSDYFDFDNDGVGIGANIGVELADVFRIEAGYTYIPVTVKATSSNPVWGGEADYNFGGPQIRALLAF